MKRKVSIFTLLISCLAVILATCAIYPGLKKVDPANVQASKTQDCLNNMDQVRLKTFKFIQPLVLVDLNNETSGLNELRSKIEQYISEVKGMQQADEISVYFRRMNNGEWFSINPNKTYNPASLSKIIYLITYLKEAETNPAILNKKVFFAHHYSDGNQQNIKDFTLKENSYYTINDLLTYMIANSDNDATQVLTENLNNVIFKQVFDDLDIPDPPQFGEYFISPGDYSKFFRVLYNASYIRPALSEMGLKLLTQCSFKDGLLKGVDSSVVVSHKFGERILGSKTQLHEFGIVFVNGDPYLIGVMTIGSNLTQLSQIVAEISRITYTGFMKVKQS